MKIVLILGYMVLCVFIFAQELTEITEKYEDLKQTHDYYKTLADDEDWLQLKNQDQMNIQFGHKTYEQRLTQLLKIDFPAHFDSRKVQQLQNWSKELQYWKQNIYDRCIKVKFDSVAYGEQRARKDIAKEKLQILLVGYPSGWIRTYREELKAKYNIDLLLMGCLTSEHIDMWTYGYNQVMESYIEQKYGKGTLESLADKSKEMFANKLKERYLKELRLLEKELDTGGIRWKTISGRISYYLDDCRRYMDKEEFAVLKKNIHLWPRVEARYLVAHFSESLLLKGVILSDDQCVAFINNYKVVVGESLKNGVVVKHIYPKQVVLQYEGIEFSLFLAE